MMFCHFPSGRHATVSFIFTRNGVDDAPTKLQQKLAVKFLQLNLDANTLPAKILFYTHGVKLACG
jgi:hypothetical protein